MRTKRKTTCLLFERMLLSCSPTDSPIQGQSSRLTSHNMFGFFFARAKAMSADPPRAVAGIIIFASSPTHFACKGGHCRQRRREQRYSRRAHSLHYTIPLQHCCCCFDSYDQYIILLSLKLPREPNRLSLGSYSCQTKNIDK